MPPIIPALIPLIPGLITLVEKLFSGKGKGKQKKKAAMEGLSMAWDVLDAVGKIPATLKPHKATVLSTMSILVDQAAAGLKTR